MLLAVLFAEAPRPVPAPFLFEELWDDRRPRNERAALHIHMTRLRGLLARADPRLADVIRTESGSYRLVQDGCEVDLAAFLSTSTRARTASLWGDTAAERSHTERALALWQGDLLRDLPTGRVYDEKREQLREVHLDLTERLHRLRIETGDPVGAVPELRQIVAAHPLRESAWYLLMQALNAAGRSAEAVAAFSAARQVLAAELGVEPGTRLRNLFQELLAA
ncbi:transcriptional regulator, SARP family [Actinobacteria bacterium OK074]|nr:transcriptional regulator, SARP family [Actinobacteria bacterium OK074]